MEGATRVGWGLGVSTTKEEEEEEAHTPRITCPQQAPYSMSSRRFDLYISACSMSVCHLLDMFKAIS
jgi:hypothetical protein